MGQVTIALNGRSYRLQCGDGEERRVEALAAHLRSHIERLAIESGPGGHDRLLVMAALLVTDELFDARESAAGKGAAVTPAPGTPSEQKVGAA